MSVSLSFLFKFEKENMLSRQRTGIMNGAPFVRCCDDLVVKTYQKWFYCYRLPCILMYFIIYALILHPKRTHPSAALPELCFLGY